MNAINQTEAQAIATTTQEPGAPAQNLIVVPLSQLRASKRNVRKIKQSIDALAESIARVGLLQNLTVILARDGEHYEVVAGGRRLDALKLLAKTRRIPKDWAVPCLLVADASARTVSLTENVLREAMHPADQFEAFAALVAEGRPIEDIAADFSVTPLVVQRRLKLANVSRRLLADYRADAVTLEQLMALAITDDHAAQDAAFYEAPEWQRQPHALRDRLTEREIDASHALVRFVGLDAYEAAAGAIVTLDRQGELVVHRGLMREAEARALRTLERLRQGFSGEDDPSDGEGEDDEQPKAAPMSDRLAQRLSAHRTAALQIELARHPQAALAAVVHGMVQTVLQKGYYSRDSLPLDMRQTVQNRLESMAPDWPESPAAVALAELQKAAGEDLPQDSADLFAVLLAKSQDELVRLLAVCAAATVDTVTPRATAQQPGAELAQAVGLDMAAWWQPTAEGYFKHVSKAMILDAVGEFAPDQVSRLAKLKKADIASEAERLVQGTGWMPAIFRAADAQDVVADEDGATAEDADIPHESVDTVAA